MVKRGSQRGRLGSSSDQRPTGREVIAFIEKFLRIPDGPYAGQPLMPVMARLRRLMSCRCCSVELI